MAKSKTTAPSDQATGPGLQICRNKHWRYISSYHGPWLSLPPEILSSLAHRNYIMPAPRLIDPCVFYDVLKIRKLVDEASQDSVRASNGFVNNALPNNGGRMDSYGMPGGGGAQFSKERVFKIRQKAVRLLARAFELDEVAASVATMAATSTLEDVGGHVLRREPNNADAKYVHFFLEKIPSRSMVQHTPLDPLEDILSSMLIHQQAPTLRTRALTQIFKSRWDSAILDLTQALRITMQARMSHEPDQQQLELASKIREQQQMASQGGHRDWKAVPQVKEEDQPSGLEKQLLFNRAGLFLTLACESVHVALDGLKGYLTAEKNGETNRADAQAQAVRLDARKRVRTFAKKAIKDYMSFLSTFDYTPGLPSETWNEMVRLAYDSTDGDKTQTPQPKDRLVEVSVSDDEFNHESPVNDMNRKFDCNSLVKHTSLEYEHSGMSEDGSFRFPDRKIYAVSDLFTERPPSDLPIFPGPDAKGATRSDARDAFRIREVVTYHPLMLDALHSLLLAHALVQTSPTEHLRHAHNAARLVRIAKGDPIFEPARSPARRDWIEVLRRANNWIGLSMPWQELCVPPAIPHGKDGWMKGPTPSSLSTTMSEALTTTTKKPFQFNGREEKPAEKRERIKQECIIDALSDDRVMDDETFNLAVQAREKRAMEDEQGLSGPLRDKERPALPSWGAKTNNEGSKDDGEKEYVISTDRAEAIARWIREAPAFMGGKRKRSARKKKTADAGDYVGGAMEGMAGLEVEGAALRDDDGLD